MRRPSCQTLGHPVTPRVKLWNVQLTSCARPRAARAGRAVWCLHVPRPRPVSCHRPRPALRCAFRSAVQRCRHVRVWRASGSFTSRAETQLAWAVLAVQRVGLQFFQSVSRGQPRPALWSAFPGAVQRSWRASVLRASGLWFVLHRPVAQPIHRADSQRQAALHRLAILGSARPAVASRSCQTLASEARQSWRPAFPSLGPQRLAIALPHRRSEGKPPPCCIGAGRPSAGGRRAYRCPRT